MLRQQTDCPLDDRGDGAYIEYTVQSWKCPLCQQFIEDRNDPSQLSVLADDCSVCREEKSKFIVRCSGGDAATFVLQCPEYDCTYSGFDWAQIRQVYPDDPAKQDVEIARGREAARQIIKDNKAAILALRDAVAIKGDVMDGKDVEHIIDHSLQCPGTLQVGV
jgi:hypothetical protein